VSRDGACPGRGPTATGQRIEQDVGTATHGAQTIAALPLVRMPLRAGEDGQVGGILDALAALVGAGRRGFEVPRPLDSSGLF
jgi:hypothetical protein